MQSIFHRVGVACALGAIVLAMLGLGSGNAGEKFVVWLQSNPLPSSLISEDDPWTTKLFQDSQGISGDELMKHDRDKYVPFVGTVPLPASSRPFRAGIPVGRLTLAVRYSDGKEGPLYCTGILISRKYLLTNFHCIPGKTGTSVESAMVYMNYLQPKQRATETQPIAKCKIGTKPASESGKLNASAELDYSIVEVFEGAGCDLSSFVGPGGFRVNPASDLPRAGDFLLMVEHPNTMPKRMPLARCTVLGNPSQSSVEFLHNCASDKGSSGSPIFSDDDKPVRWVGLHYRGADGLAGSNDANGAILASEIVKDSTILQRIAREQASVVPANFAQNEPIPVIGTETQQRERVGALQTNLQSFGSDDVFKVVASGWPQPLVKELEFDFRERFIDAKGLVASETAGRSVVSYRPIGLSVWSVKRSDSYESLRPQNQKLRIASVSEGVETLAGLLEVFADTTSTTTGTVLNDLDFNEVNASSRKLHGVKIRADAKFPRQVGDSVSFEFAHCIIVNALPCSMSEKNVNIRFLRHDRNSVAGDVIVLGVSYGNDNPNLALKREFDFSLKLGCFVGSRQSLDTKDGSFQTELKLRGFKR